jgi:hypothetical protein
MHLQLQVKKCICNETKWTMRNPLGHFIHKEMEEKVEVCSSNYAYFDMILTKHHTTA